MNWQPDCSLSMLRLRAGMLRTIRRFFEEKSVLEVETPLLCSAIGTDPNLDFFSTTFDWPPTQRQLFLQTSPEFAMKRLLAAGSGSIYQICKAFRNGESGRYHNPEFTLLEWYRVGFGLHDLMAEVAELVAAIFADKAAYDEHEQIDYQSLFRLHTGLDALAFSGEAYADYACRHGISEAISICGNDHAAWLDFIFSHRIQPHLGKDTLCLVYGYPACFSSLARLNKENNNITDRFELFIQGVELGNGYFELNDAEEQSRRFDREIKAREMMRRPQVIRDERLLAALAAGLPDCSGVAIGLDRLLMLLANRTSIQDVLTFSVCRA